MKVYAKISVLGVKPLLFHTFPMDTLTPGKAKSGTAGRCEQEWKSTVLMMADRQLYILGSYPVASIKHGGKLIKVGKSSMLKKVESCLECSDNKILIDNRFVPEEKDLTTDETQDVYLDVRSVVNPMTKGRNLRYRIAAKAGWSFTTVISWDDGAVSSETIRQCIDNGGTYEGVGDGRRIGFGRYKCTSFEMV